MNTKILESFIQQYEQEVLKKYVTFEGFKEFVKSKGAFIVSLTVGDGVRKLILTIGSDPAGTDGYNPDLDQFLPPPPPAGAFDARLIWQNEAYLKDFRSSELDEYSFIVKYSKSAEGTGLYMEWDPKDVEFLSSATIMDTVNGTLFSQDMKTTSKVDIAANAAIGDKLHIKIVK